MSGSGGASGYNFQARAIAYVEAHILAQRRLDWIDHSIPDIPIAVATETGQAGDDIQITLQDGIKIEIQAKKGLRYDQKFWDALVRLVCGLAEEPDLYGILLINSTATGIIKNDLCQDFEHLGAGGFGKLKKITQEVINRFNQENIQVDSELFRRLKIIEANFQNSSPEVKFASELLSNVVEDSNQAKNAWKVLDADAHQLIEIAGGRNAVRLTQLLSNIPIQLSATAINPVVVIERYQKWLKTNETTIYFRIPGFDGELFIETAWIQLQACIKRKENEAFKADYIPYLYHQVVVTGSSGAGKSTFLQRRANYLSNLGKLVLWVRLPRIAEYYDQGKPFAEAILIDAAENSGIEINQLKAIFASLDYLLADGLDECEGLQGTIVRELVSWSGGHSDTRIIVTTRPENYDVGMFPGWEHIELLPLNSWDIKKNARQLLEARFTDESQIEEQLDLFEQRLKVNRTASLAAQSPLLLGFLVQLSINDVELSQCRAGLYQSIIELSYEQSPADKEFKVKLDPPTAFRVIEIVGWTLQNSPEISEHTLVEVLGKELANELDLKLLAAQREARKGLDFWKERRIVECLRVGHQKTIAFVHLSLQEYTAGKYGASLTDEELRKWLIRVGRESKWRDIILFSAGAGAAERISTCLLHLDDSEKSISDVWLAADALAQTNEPSLKCVEELAKRLHPLLESPIDDVAFRTADALLPFTARAADFIGSIVQPLCNHVQRWTRLAAMRLALNCGEDYVDLSILRKIFDSIYAEISNVETVDDDSKYITHSIDSGTRTRKTTLDFNKLLKDVFENFTDTWDCYPQILPQAAQVLMRQQPSFELSQKILQLTRIEAFGGEIRVSLLNLIYAYFGSLNWEERQEQTKLLGLDEPLKLYKAPVELFSPEKILKNIKDTESSIRADRAILEAVLRATDDTLETPPQRSSEKVINLDAELNRYTVQAILESIIYTTNGTLEVPLQRPLDGLINLGLLLSGMGWWNVSHREWLALINCHDLDAVDTVFKGAIAAMSIDLQELAVETAWALEYIKRTPSYDQNCNAVAASRYLREIRNLYLELHNQIPQLPAEPKWELARNVTLSPQALVHALKHSSNGIRLNAARLLEHGAGGEEATNLAQEFLEEN